MKKLLSVAVLGGCLSLSAGVFAADVDFNGHFSNDNDVQLFNFSVGAPGDVTIFTSSWLSGGFDPILGLWDSSGNQILEQDDGSLGGSTVSNGVNYAYGEFDSFINLNLAAGHYFATLSQYDNFSAGAMLADGFLRDGEPQFTSAFGCSNGIFCEGSLFDSNNNPVEPNRTSAWELHFVNVDSASFSSIPEPSTLALSGLCGIGLLAGRLRNGKQTLPAA